MDRFKFRIAVLAVAAVLVAALPVSAQVIKADVDRWVTPNGGGTYFKFPDGEVESLCNETASFDWDHTVALTGVPVAGQDWDTAVARLKDVDVTNGGGVTPIQVKHLEFKSLAPHSTPCGRINWSVETVGNQPMTKMAIRRKSERGGIFWADIAVRVQFTATDAGSGAFIGKLIYTMELPATTNGVAWSFDGANTFRPGIDEMDNCIDVLREKLLTATGAHVYFIEDLIAQGKCKRQG